MLGNPITPAWHKMLRQPLHVMTLAAFIFRTLGRYSSQDDAGLVAYLHWSIEKESQQEGVAQHFWEGDRVGSLLVLVDYCSWFDPIRDSYVRRIRLISNVVRGSRHRLASIFARIRMSTLAHHMRRAGRSIRRLYFRAMLIDRALSRAVWKRVREMTDAIGLIPLARDLKLRSIAIVVSKMLVAPFVIVSRLAFVLAFATFTFSLAPMKVPTFGSRRMPMRAARRDHGILSSAARRMGRLPRRAVRQTATRVIARMVLAFRVFAALRVSYLYPIAREMAFRLLIVRGDLVAAEEAFRRLTQLKSSAARADGGLHEFMCRLLPLARTWMMRQPSDTALARRPAIVLSVVVVRQNDVDLFENYCVPSLLAEFERVQSIVPQGFKWLIHTTFDVRQRLRANPRFCQLTDPDVVFIIVPEFLIKDIDRERNNWLEVVCAMVAREFSAANNAGLVVLGPSNVYSSGFLANLMDSVADDEVVVFDAIEVETLGFSESLMPYRMANGAISLDARSLLRLGFDHLSPLSQRSFVDPCTLSRGMIPNSLCMMWREDDTVVLRSAAPSPVFLGAKADALKAFWFDVHNGLVLCRQRAVGWTRNAVEPATSERAMAIVRLSPENSEKPRLINVKDISLRFFETQAIIANLKQEVRLIVTPRSESGVDAVLLRSRYERFLADLESGFAAIAKENRSWKERSLTINICTVIANVLFRMEVSSGCVPVLNEYVREFRDLLLSSRVPLDAESANPEGARHLAIAFLRLGLLEELNILRKKFDLKLPEELAEFIDLCHGLFVESHAAGAAWRQNVGHGELFVISGIVWGDAYIKNFMEFNVRSMLAPGNIPELSSQGKVKYFVTTNAAGQSSIMGHPIYAKSTVYLNWHFCIVPDGIIEEMMRSHTNNMFYMLYGMLDHASIYFAQGADAHIFMMPVDAVVSDRALTNMANYRHAGYECCGGGNIVAVAETFLSAIAERFANASAITISTEELANLAVANKHQYFSSQLICQDNTDFGKWPRELFWPVENGIRIHSCFIHPLFTTVSALRRYTRRHFANVDYGMIPRMFVQADKIKIISDTTEAYINNFAGEGREFDTTKRAFAYDDFVMAHTWTYPVQRQLFAKAQFVPCSHIGSSEYRDIETDVAEINKRLMLM